MIGVSIIQPTLCFVRHIDIQTIIQTSTTPRLVFHVLSTNGWDVFYVLCNRLTLARSKETGRQEHFCDSQFRNITQRRAHGHPDKYQSSTNYGKSSLINVQR